MIFPVLLMAAVLVLFPLPFFGGWEVDPRTAAPIIDDAEANCKANCLMNGIRLISWDGQNQLFCLQIELLEAVPKAVGSFKLVDHRDLWATNCFIKSESASLAVNFQEIGKLLVNMLKPLKKPSFRPLVYLPPKLEAKPFSCTITQSPGGEVILQADLAAFYPGQTYIFLKGKVRANFGNQTCITAEQMVWSLTAQELNAKGPYTFQADDSKIRGRDACFSLSGGRIKRIKTIMAYPPSILPNYLQLP